MRRRHGRVNRWLLVAVAALSLGLFVLVQGTRRSKRARFYLEKLAAAQEAARLADLAGGLRNQLGIPVDTVNDPNRTGLIGLQYSQLTFGRSDLSDALTTTNPNFAAALVQMLRQAGVRRGDSVGISWDGSYPALNLGLLGAVTALELRPVIVTAQSAATWGANYPGMSWLDIERHLAESGGLRFRTRLATYGGEDDAGRGLAPAGREVLRSATDSAGVELYVPADLAEAVKRRREVFTGCRLVVAAGQVAADIGEPTVRVPSRLLGRGDVRVAGTGTIAELLLAGQPVLVVRNPARVARDHGLPDAPEPNPRPGAARLFRVTRYSALLAGVCAAVLLGVVLVVVRYDIESYLGVRRSRNEEEAV